MRSAIIAAVMSTMLLAACAFGAKHNQYKVLVVMSYESEYLWVKQLREGIEATLEDCTEISYFYLNTKANWQDGPERAKEAYDLFCALSPDGVIVADDDAQAMFTVPYLKDRYDTPVIFCGVNADPSEYGFPSVNVTGVLEREPMKQSLLFLRQLAPSVKTVGFIAKDSPTGKAVEAQLLLEKSEYPTEYIGSQLAHTMPEAIEMAKTLRSKCDALIYITMEGLPDEDGTPLSDKDILPVIAKTFGKPVITNGIARAKWGALSAMVRSGLEDGSIAGEMLLEAMEGTPVKDLPVVTNAYGYRVLNVDTMVSLGIEPDAMIVRSATLIRNEK